MCERTFAMRRKGNERLRARELREQGWALRRIAAELDVSLSSVSVWVRGVGSPAEARPTRMLPPPPAAHEELVPVPVVRAASLRRCGSCKLALPLTSFGRHPNGRQWWCKRCFRAYFAKRGQLHRDQTKAALARRKMEARELVKERLRAGCSDCGEGDPTVLEFDHIRAKEGTVCEQRLNTGPPATAQTWSIRCRVGSSGRAQTLTRPTTSRREEGKCWEWSSGLRSGGWRSSRS